MLSVFNRHYNSCKTLLELGADVNIHDHSNGSSAILEAAHLERDIDDDTRFLKLLLKYGANPNDEEVGNRKVGNTTRNTPLLNACGNVYVSPLAKVKLLVDADADVNHKNEYRTTPLIQATLLGQYTIIPYLLEKGADYTLPIVNRNGKKIFLVNMLREEHLPLDSKDYLYKMQIVDFLKRKGIDYKKTPIPDYIIKDAQRDYPNNWQEYLEKY